MVKLTFKNVGQGDSILLEWNEDGINKIGVIDCNLRNNSNPVLEYIITEEYKEIEFLILSHPHLDHFSGFFELLDYCRTNKILIKRFRHTSSMTKAYLKMANRSAVADKQLQKLFKLLKEMRDNGETSVNILDDDPDRIINLGNEFKMEILAPSALDFDNYIKRVNYPFDEEISSANPNANWLSTVIKVYNSKISVILTSDAETSVLTRIGKRKGGRLGLDKLALGQVPHHGSKGNLNKQFWQLRKRLPITSAVISVGENIYRHPSTEVLEFFDKLSNYKVERTDENIISEQNESRQNISNLLDLFSTRISVSSSSDDSGDKIFKLSGDTCDLI